MKRFLMSVLALTMLLSCTVPAFAAEESAGLKNFKKTAVYTDGLFDDVAETDWYRSSVAAVYELGLMKGGGDGSFNVGGNVTIAETLVLADKLYSIYHTGKAEFTTGSPWYQPYVDYALDCGILTGPCEDYAAPATRREFVAILSRALPPSVLPVLNPLADGDVPDVDMGSAYSKEIYRFYRAGILAGSSVYGHFRPETTISRSETAAIVTRLAYRSLRVRFTLEELVYPDLEKQDAPADDAYFADAAMLGNSLVDGMELFSGLPMSYFGGTGLTVYKNKLDELLKQQYGKVYVEFGINELGGNFETIIDSYRKNVEQIKAAMPEAQVYLMAVTPVTKARSDAGSFTMERITAFNEALRTLAEEMECWYLDCCTPLCDENGYLPEEFGGWDGSPHLSVEGYQAWADVIRDYYA